MLYLEICIFLNLNVCLFQTLLFIFMWDQLSLMFRVMQVALHESFFLVRSGSQEQEPISCFCNGWCLMFRYTTRTGC